MIKMLSFHLGLGNSWRWVRFIIVVMMVLFAINEKPYASILLDKIVATVNGEVITWSEMIRAIEFEKRQDMKGLGLEERGGMIKRYERTILDGIIDMRLQLQEAKRRGITVSPSEVNDAIKDIKKKYNLTDKQFLDSLKAEGFTEDAYKKELSEQILLAKVINIEVRSMVAVTDKEIEEYYKKNEKLYDKTKIKVRQIFFKRPGDGSIEKVEKMAMEVMKRIQDGEDFALLAKRFSEDPNAESGGDIGYIERGSVLKEIEDAAFSLNEGEVSKPFWSSKGIHIIKVEKRLEGGLEDARDEIKKILMEEAFQKRYEDWIKGLRERAYIEVRLQ